MRPPSPFLSAADAAEIRAALGIAPLPPIVWLPAKVKPTR